MRSTALQPPAGLGLGLGAASALQLPQPQQQLRAYNAWSPAQRYFVEGDHVIAAEANRTFQFTGWRVQRAGPWAGGRVWYSDSGRVSSRAERPCQEGSTKVQGGGRTNLQGVCLSTPNRMRCGLASEERLFLLWEAGRRPTCRLFAIHAASPATSCTYCAPPVTQPVVPYGK